MTARTGICPGCGESKRIGTVSAPAAALFCQSCAHGIPEKARVVIVQLVGMQRCLDLNVRKLESNAQQLVEKRRHLSLMASGMERFRVGDEDYRQIFERMMPCWLAPLEAETGPLIAKIARQKTAIDVLRRKHGLHIGPAWGLKIQPREGI